MDPNVFGSHYASLYDLTYRDKPYEVECDLLVSTFRRHCAFPVHRVLDLGCGTGSHALLLAGRGFEVVGVDRSEPMLECARTRAAAGQQLPVSFRHGDILGLDLGEHFDAALMMFAVLGYQLDNRDVLAALGAARRHLAPGGLLVFDFWYGPAVLRQRPSPRVRTLEGDGSAVIRICEGTLDVDRHLCRVEYQLLSLMSNGGLSRLTESHRMRFFFPREIELFLTLARFELLELSSFPDRERAPDETTWNVMAVASAMEADAVTP